MTTLGCSGCNQWTMEGDGSQRFCVACDGDCSGGPAKRKYISEEAFNKKAKLVEAKWGELSTENVYFINAVHERVVKGETSKYAELENIVSGERTTAWLPSLISKELETHNVVKTPTYIQSLGKRDDIERTREYYDFVIITDDDSKDNTDTRRYLSIDQFKAKAEMIRNISKWGTLTIGETYYINYVRQRQTSKYAELEDIKNGVRSIVWLPGLIASVLEKEYDLNIPTYIRPMGMKQTIDGARKYHDFLIVTDDGE